MTDAPATLQTPHLSEYVGADPTPSVPAAQQITVFLGEEVRGTAGKKRNIKNVADKNSLVEQVVWEVKPTQVAG